MKILAEWYQNIQEKIWVLRGSKLGQKFPQTDKYLEVHHTKWQNCSITAVVVFQYQIT